MSTPVQIAWERLTRGLSVRLARELKALQTFLDSSECRLARIFTERSTDTVGDDEAARALENELIRQLDHRVSAEKIVTQLQIVYGLIKELNGLGLSIKSTRIGLLRPPTPSPFRASEMALASTAHRWEVALLKWIHRGPTTDDPKELVGAVILSSVLFGMLLNPRVIDMWLARLHLPLTVACNFSFTDFLLGFRGQDDAHLHRWFPDPITEILFSRLPVSAEPLVSDTKGVLSAIAQVLRNGGFTERDGMPASLSQMTTYASALWMTKASRVDVLYASGVLRTHSLRLDVWLRLLGCAPPMSAQDVQSGQIQADAGSELDSEDDILCAPWYFFLSAQLESVSGKVDRDRVQQLAAELPAESSARLYIEWLEFLLDEKSASGKPMKPSTAIKYFRAVTSRLLSMLGETSALTIGHDERCAIFALIMDDCLQTNWRDVVAKGLREFQFFLNKKHGALSFASVKAALGEVAVFRTVDANVVSEEEYLATQRWLAGQIQHGKSLRLVRVAQLVLTLFYRLGARRMEIIRARVCDFHIFIGADLLIRPHEFRDLKTDNSTRRLPVSSLLLKSELEELTHWHTMRVREENDDPNSVRNFFTVENGKEIPPDLLTDLLTKGLRFVTGDTSVHPHLLRHSMATFTDLMLRTADYRDGCLPYTSLTETYKRLSEGAQLRARLTGVHKGPSRLSGFVVARLLGHFSPAISWSCYVHHFDIVRLGIVSAVLPKLSLADYQRLSGLPMTTTAETLTPHNPVAALARKVRDRHISRFFIAPARPVLSPKAGRPENPAVLMSFDVIRSILSAEKSSESICDFIADDLPHSSSEVAAVLRAANEFKDLKARIGGARKEVKNFWSRTGSIQTFVRDLEGRLQALASVNMPLLLAGCDLFLTHLNGTKMDVTFKGRHELKSARVFVRFLLALNYKYADIRLLLRGDAPESGELTWWRDSLKLDNTAKAKFIEPPVAQKGESFKDWIGFHLLDPANGKPVIVPTAMTIFLCRIGIEVLHQHGNAKLVKRDTTIRGHSDL